MKIDVNVVFEFLNDSPNRISSLRGGTRSGKTYNILIYWIIRLLNERGKVLTIGRNTMPALRASAMRDFFEILENLNLYDPERHNKTSNEYSLGTNLIEFVGVSEDRRIRGRKRDYLFLNEANECDLEAFRQLAFRTTGKIVLDYNPSETHSWIYEQVETREDCDLLTTTFLDNPFLDDSIVGEIERLKDADPAYWAVYGLGQIANISNIIYTHWKPISTVPNGEKYYGLDFGYNNPTALVETTLSDDALYWREMLYQSKLTNADLIEKLKTFPELATGTIIADSAEPQRIEEIRRAGFRIEPAFKSIKETVDFAKSKPLFIEENSTNLLREIKKYSWKRDKDGNVLDEVVKFDDHANDAARYASFKFNQPKQIWEFQTFLR